MLETARKKTRPRVVDLYDIFLWNSLCLKKWLPVAHVAHEYPGWQLCYYYFSLWNSKDCLDSISILEQV